ALRTYAVEIFDRVGERDWHRIRCECITFISSVAVREARSRFTGDGARFNNERRERKILNSWRGLERINRCRRNSGWLYGRAASEVARAVQSVEMLRYECAEPLRQRALAACKPLPCNILEG